MEQLQQPAQTESSSAIATPAQKRLRKELMELIKSPPEGVSMSQECIDRLNQDGLMNLWIVDLKGASNTLFEGEEFKLQLKFCDKFPFECPEVVFVGENVPEHPHIYSNGHICLSILADEWSPALTVVSICLSILSMLSSCTKKGRPQDNASYVRGCRGSPKKTRFWFHDDTV